MPSNARAEEQGGPRRDKTAREPVRELVTLVLAGMHVHFSWFSLHPIGFIVASGFPASAMWLSLFIGWILKAAIMRWGGYKTYHTLRPFFFGLVIGDCLAAGVWNIIGYITGQGYAVIPF